MRARLDALKQRATVLYEAGKHAEAVSLVEGYVETMQSRHGADHPDYAVALKMLATALRSTNRPAEAEPHYRRALAIDEKNLGPEHPVLSISGLLRKRTNIDPVGSFEKRLTYRHAS